jgi:hypothetical protein
MKTLILIASPAILLSMPVAAAEEPKAANDDSKIVCQIAETTGSRLRRSRACKMKSEWREEARQQRDLLDNSGPRVVDAQSRRGG